MSSGLLEQLVEAGVHFGHRASRWNPKMRPYIYGRQKLVHIIDLRETVRGLLRGKKYLRDLASKGGIILFVGTKRQASESVEREAQRARMPFVAERWLGGTLTNFRTIRSRMGRLEELESLRSGDELQTYSKKMQSALAREFRKMFRNLNGIRTMTRIPDCLVVVDPKKEKNAILEARAMGVPTVAIIDTDCDPDMVDLPIPGNDDGIRSIEILLSHLADAILEGGAYVVADQEGNSATASKGSDSASDEPSGKLERNDGNIANAGFPRQPVSVGSGDDGNEN